MRRNDVPGSKRRGWRRFVSGLTIVVVGASALIGFGAGAAALGRRARAHDPDRTPIRAAAGARVVLWGDSLAYEAALPFVARLRNETHDAFAVDARTFGGTATCDWLPDMRRQAAAGPIAAAVLEFSGNALTRCMTDPGGQPLRGQAYLRAYRDATLEAVRILQAAGARVYLVGAPPSRRPSAEGAALLGLYRALATQRTGVVFVDAGRVVLDDGHWTATLPCLVDESAADGCVAGRIVVRAPAGAHFCPGAGPAVGGVTGPCPRWSSGATRFGRAMADAVAGALEGRST
jgi:hypothetical protein